MKNAVSEQRGPVRQRRWDVPIAKDIIGGSWLFLLSGKKVESSRYLLPRGEIRARQKGGPDFSRGQHGRSFPVGSQKKKPEQNQTHLPFANELGNWDGDAHEEGDQ